MSPRVRILAGIWLALAGLGAAIALGAIALLLGYARRHGYGPDEVLALPIAFVALWCLPLTIASVAILRARRWGMVVLAVHAGLSSALWAAFVLVYLPQMPDIIRDLVASGDWRYMVTQALLGLLDAALAGLSGFTVYALIRELAASRELSRRAVRLPGGPKGRE